MQLEGIFPIVPTPFLENGAVDYASIERLIDFMAGKRVHGLAIMGALGLQRWSAARASGAESGL